MTTIASRSEVMVESCGKMRAETCGKVMKSGSHFEKQQLSSLKVRRDAFFEHEEGTG